MENIIKEKYNKLQELHKLEDEVNLSIATIDKRLKGLDEKKIELKNKKRKLAKQVSHNMKLRNTIIEEIETLKRQTT